MMTDVEKQITLSDVEHGKSDPDAARASEQSKFDPAKVMIDIVT